MKEAIFRNLPVIIIATISVVLFGVWYMSLNVNKNIVINASSDAPPVIVETPYTADTGTPPEKPGGELEKEDKTVNINTADMDALMALPGIGQTIANAIIVYREENGGFKSTEDIKNVYRIGEKTYEAIKDLITVE